MKNFIKTSLFLIIASLFFSCDKENDTYIDEQNNILKDIQLITYHGNNKSANTGYSMLYFKDMETFRQTIKNLEIEAEQHDDAYIAAYPNMSADELTLNESEVGYDYYEPFKNFEKQYNFNNSMFKGYQIALNNWLNTEDLKPEDDPDIAYLELEPEELVVLNDDGAVKIGDDIYFVYNGGEIIFNDISVKEFSGVIDTISTNTGFDFSGFDFTGLDFSFDLTWGDILGFSGTEWADYSDIWDPAETCFQDARTEDQWSVGSKKRLKGVVKAVDSQTFGKKIKAKSKYYKKYWVGWLENRASSLKAALNGSVENSCGDNNYYWFDEDVNYTYKTNSFKAKYKVTPEDIGFSNFYIPYNLLEGVHEKGGNRHAHILEP